VAKPEEVFVRLTGLSIDTAKEEGETDAGWIEEILYDLGAAWAIARKDMKIYYLKPSILGIQSTLPVCDVPRLASREGYHTGRSLPGLLAITLLFSATSIDRSPYRSSGGRRHSTSPLCPDLSPAIVLGQA